jgi:hypothetical protein
VWCILKILGKSMGCGYGMIVAFISTRKNLNRKYFNCNTQIISWIGDNKEVMGAQRKRVAEFR